MTTFKSKKAVLEYILRCLYTTNGSIMLKGLVKCHLSIVNFSSVKLQQVKKSN